MINKLFGIISSVLVLVLAALAVFFTLSAAHSPAMKLLLTDGQAEPLINSTTILRQENKYTTCGDVEVYYRGAAQPDLIGLDEKRLLLKFPEQDGWKISVQEDEVNITKQVAGLCGMHKEYRHLSVDNGFLAVYQGPLGYDDVILRIESGIDIHLLPEQIQTDLKSAENFDELSSEKKAALKKTLQFTDEKSLNVLLENFDEYEVLE